MTDTLITDAKKPNIRQRRAPTSLVTPEHLSAEPGSYKVGRGKPPIEHRFKPGKSGNPKGRPKGARGMNAMVRDLMHKKIAIRTPKGTRKVPHAEALLMRLLEMAIKGDLRAIERCLAHYAAAEPRETMTVDAPTDEPLSATDELILATFLASQTNVQAPSDGGGDE